MKMSLEDLLDFFEQHEDTLEESELELVEGVREAFFGRERISYDTKTTLEELVEVIYERFG